MLYSICSLIFKFPERSPAGLKRKSVWYLEVDTAGQSGHAGDEDVKSQFAESGHGGVDGMESKKLKRQK